MCWTGFLTDKKVAEKNITCYKIISQYQGKYYAYYRVTPYEFNKLYEEPITPLKRNALTYSHSVFEGLHCYSENVKIKYYYGCFIVNTANITQYTPNFPHFESNVRFNVLTFYMPIVVKCIIPKGTVYYENKHGDIVSEKLILKEIVCNSFVNLEPYQIINK
jgi:hypothetical protein